MPRKDSKSAQPVKRASQASRGGRSQTAKRGNRSQPAKQSNHSQPTKQTGRSLAVIRGQAPRHELRPFPTIPKDIKRMIFHELGSQLLACNGSKDVRDPAVYDTWKTVIACSRVSRKVRKIMLPYLLDSLPLDYVCEGKEESRSVKSFKKLLSTQPDIATGLRTVTLSWGCFRPFPKPTFPLVAVRGLAKVLSNLSNLRDLTLKGVMFDTDGTLDDVRSAVQPLDLDSFKLELPDTGVKTALASLVLVFCMLGKVKDLYLEGKLAGEWMKIAHAKSFVVSPTRLFLRSGDSAMFASHMMALDVLDVTQVSHVELDLGADGTMERPRAFEALLKRIGDNLKSLRVRFGSIRTNREPSNFS